MNLLRSLVALLVVTASGAGSALAQHTLAPDALQPGERLRFSVDTVPQTGAYAPPRSRQWRSVVLDSVVQSDLWVHSQTLVTRVPLSALTGLQVRRPPLSIRHTIARGALVGAAWGTGLSIAHYVLFRLEQSQSCWNVLDSDDCHGEGPEVKDYLSYFVVPSTVIGVGFSVVLLPAVRSRWESVALPKSALSVSLTVP
jgi:hypothetical protein